MTMLQVTLKMTILKEVIKNEPSGIKAESYHHQKLSKFYHMGLHFKSERISLYNRRLLSQTEDSPWTHR